MTSSVVPDAVDLRTKVLQLEKLELEVQALREQVNPRGILLKLVPLLTAVIAVIGFLVGVYQNKVTREKEFKRHFWESQLKYYVEASEVAAKLATLPDGHERLTAYQRFQELYHGGLVVFEDEQVMNAMRDFAQQYIDFLEDPGLQPKLQESARALARTCRESAAHHWDVDLKRLDVRRS